ncbi:MULTISPECIES: hypothetical protein [unclassified Bosea (in: a-proteobacteria)]|uniref:hypothetical protein n=1 Tax=unclassified Bosea (in: a-proteobacteria) TaxID=2653178 RepID=UPI001F19E369|nr:MULTISPECIES: hypothetical protein [unclassified Bosea (in: a-proteobacteria)]
MSAAAGIDLIGDDELAYLRSRTAFVAGAGMALDEGYRLAHLPLIDPAHPKAIARKDGTHYDNGRHPPIYSLVVPMEGLSEQPAYRELEDELRHSPFSDKIAWDLVERRRAKLHATVCGSLSVGTPPAIDSAARAELARLGPITLELRGLFSGNVNRGRLYLRFYPERRDGQNALHLMQRALGRPTSDLYVVGIWNLSEDLDAAEAALLAAMLDRWWDRPILRFTADRLWLMGASDDLVLDSEIVETISLK